MNISLLILIIISTFFLGCSPKKTKILEVYRGNKNSIITKKCLLFKGQLEFVSTSHNYILYDERPDDLWRKQGWLAPGTPITIKLLMKTIHPMIGEVFYYAGEVDDANRRIQKFIYISEHRSFPNVKLDIPFKIPKDIVKP